MRPGEDGKAAAAQEQLQQQQQGTLELQETIPRQRKLRVENSTKGFRVVLFVGDEQQLQQQQQQQLQQQPGTAVIPILSAGTISIECTFSGGDREAMQRGFLEHVLFDRLPQLTFLSFKWPNPSILDIRLLKLLGCTYSWDSSRGCEKRGTRKGSAVSADIQAISAQEQQQ